MPRQDPPVVTTLRQYREALEARELATMQDMARRWVEIERRLDGDIAALALEMQRRIDAGEVVTQQIVWKAQRYQQIKARLAEEMRIYNQDAATPIITAAQKSNAWMGVESARDAIYAGYNMRNVPYFPILSRAQVETMAGLLGNGSPLSTLLKQDYPDALAGLSNALVNGMARGLGASATAAAMADGMGMGLERAMLIARTEMNRAYRMASVQQYRESRVVSGFRRLVKKATACMACLMLDGQKFDTADELDDHPRGKCVAIPILIDGPAAQWQTGPQWFNTLTADEQRAKMGPEKYQLWKDGVIQPADLAGVHHSPVWGDSPRVKTIQELTA